MDRNWDLTDSFLRAKRHAIRMIHERTRIKQCSYVGGTILKERVFTTLGEWHSIDYNDKATGRLSLITKIVEILSES